MRPGLLARRFRLRLNSAPEREAWTLYICGGSAACPEATPRAWSLDIGSGGSAACCAERLRLSGGSRLTINREATPRGAPRRGADVCSRYRQLVARPVGAICLRTWHRMEGN